MLLLCGGISPISEPKLARCLTCHYDKYLNDLVFGANRVICLINGTHCLFAGTNTLDGRVIKREISGTQRTDLNEKAMDVLVAEDESLARESLVHLLRERSDIDEVHSVADGNEAIAALDNHDFDVLLLDVQMPGYSGIEVATHAKPDQHIIFTTAYDHYAVKAFELNAIDYVLKPFADSRLYEALDKVSQKYQSKQHDYQELAQLVHQSLDLNKTGKRLVLRESKKVKLFDHNDIAYIKGAGNYIEVVFTDGKKQLFRETLGKVEEQLHDTAFIRIHKSTIVRSDLISELNSSGKGDYKVILKSGCELVLSRRHKDKLSPLLFNE